MVELASLQVTEKSAAPVADRLRQYKQGVTPPEEVQDAVQTVLMMARLTLSAWDVVQRFVVNGAEGGQARALVGKVCATVEAWLENVRVVIRWIPQWHQQGGAPLSGFDTFSDFERRLDEALNQAKKLLAFVNEPPPPLSPEALNGIEGAADDKSNQYLSAQEFLARVRARRGA